MKPIWEDNRRTLVGLCLTTLVFSTFLSVIAYINNGSDPLAFAHIGTRFSEGNPSGTTGYDGQFAYYIARDGAAAVPSVDGPTLRYQRILYPLVSRALALGNVQLVPWTLLIVNLAAHSIGVGLLAYIVKLLKGPMYAALIYTFWIGVLFGVRFDLNEPLCFALGLGAVAAYLHQHYRWTIFFLMLSTMTKELGLVIAAGVALHAFLQGNRRWGVLLFGGPLLLFLSWWGIMRVWLGTFPTRYPAGKIHLVPLQGMFHEDNPIELLFLAIWLGIPAIILFAAAIYDAWRSRKLALGTSLIIAGSGFVMVMPDVSWDDPAAAYRVGIPLIVAGVIFVAERFPHHVKWLLALWLPTVFIVFLIPGVWL